MIQNYSSYRHHMADGKYEHILIPWDPQTDHGWIQGPYKCIYLDSNQRELAFTYAKKGYGHPSFSRMSAYLIRCPLPSNLTIQSTKDLSLFQLEHLSFPKKRTFPAPTCHIPSYSLELARRKYELTICLAVSMPTKILDKDSFQQLTKQWIEWLEYHQYLGVQHVFLYDTTPIFPKRYRKSNQHKQEQYQKLDYLIEIQPGRYFHRQLYQILRQYLHNYFVTWHYEQCVQGMASGRGIITHEICSNPRNGSSCNDFFQPPRPIAHTSALASCYNRFRHTTKFMLHIDVDEFIVLHKDWMSLVNSKNKTNENITSTNKSLSLETSLSTFKLFPGQSNSPTKSWNNKGNYNLIQFANYFFNFFPHKHVLSFRPLFLYSCNTTKSSRLMNYLHGELGAPFESKLLMKTNEIAMFYIHYITYLEKDMDNQRHSTSKRRNFRQNPKTIRLDLPTHIGLLHHYKEKDSQSARRRFWGGNLSILSTEPNYYNDLNESLCYDPSTTFSFDATRHSHSKKRLMMYDTINNQTILLMDPMLKKKIGRIIKKKIYSLLLNEE